MYTTETSFRRKTHIEPPNAQVQMGSGQARQLPTGEGKALSGNDLKIKSEIPIRISYNAKKGLRLNEKNLIEGGSGEFPASSGSSWLRPKIS